MVNLPENFIAIRFEGYFLNITNMCLYSLKQTGALRELKHRNKTMWCPSSGYTISQRGQSYTVTDDYLQTTKQIHLKSPKLVTIKVTNVYCT